MGKRNQVTLRWSLLFAVVAVLLAGVFGVTATGNQPVAMTIDQPNAAPAGSELVWNSPDNPNYPRLPALIVPPRGGDPIGRP
jgi:hypothetical protein